MPEELLAPGLPLCVVGNLNRDIKLAGVAPSPALFEDGETSVAGVIETSGGGGANSACAAATLGAATRFVGKVGADALGERLRQVMERFGVRTFLKTEPDGVTGTTVALGFTSGHRHFLSRLPNNESLRFADLDLAALDGCAARSGIQHRDITSSRQQRGCHKSAASNRTLSHHEQPIVRLTRTPHANGLGLRPGPRRRCRRSASCLRPPGSGTANSGTTRH